MKRFLKEKVVSEITGKAVSTLRNDRFNGVGIPYCKTGRSITYDYDDVITYMERHKVPNSSQNELTQK